MIKYKVGKSIQISKTITEEDINTFANITMDYNPLHVNQEYAENSRFGKKIAHGLLTASLISAGIGTKLHKGAIYLSQTLTFLKPVYIGDTITAKITIKEIKENKPILKLDTICINQKNDIVLHGEAVILLE